MKIKNLYLLLFLLLTINFGIAQITIDDSLTTQELVENYLFNSSCTDLSNFSQSTGTDFGDPNGIGAFNANNSDFPFLKGIILSSGSVLNAPGPNLTPHSDGTFSWPGDADLEANTTATNTNNASYIQFEFIPQIDQISFNFLFASEEYNQNFECTFSDAFAFILVHQESGTSENLAVLPGTNIPIEATNIHPEVNGQCPAINEEFFDKYNFLPYNDENSASIDYNGQIVTLTAQGEVIAGDIYTIKLVIADETDTALDSAVFIEAGSFNIGNIDLGIDITPDNNNSSCEGEIIILDAGNSDNSTFQWFKNGVELTGETNSILEVTTDGTYKVDVSFAQSPDCIASDEIEVEFYKNPIVELGENIIICDGESVDLDATISNPSDIQNVTYTWFRDGEEILGETESILNVSDIGVYTVIVSSDYCTSTDNINVLLQLLSISLGNDFNTCPLTSNTIFVNSDQTNLTYQWYLNSDLIEDETSENIEVILEANTIGAQEYKVIVSNGICTIEDTIEVSLKPNNECIITQGISPDGSIGFNDELDLTFLNDRSGINNLQIYNRYGTIVYEKDNYINQWIGQTTDGHKLPTGTYYYFITLKSQDPVYGSQPTGWIYLNRNAK